MDRDTALISIEEFDRLREIEKNAEKIILRHKDEGGGGTFSIIWGSDQERPSVEYVGKDEALKAIADAATKTEAYLKDELEKVKKTAGKYNRLTHSFKDRWKFLFKGSVE